MIFLRQIFIMGKIYIFISLNWIVVTVEKKNTNANIYKLH